MRRSPGLRRPIRGVWVNRRLQFAAIALATVAALAAVGALVVRTHDDVLRADQQSSAYRPPPIRLTAPVPTPTAAGSPGPLVTVISDDTTSGAQGAVAGRLWPAIVEKTLKVDLSPYADAGAGYVTTADDGDGTFASTATNVDPASAAVVFFGGANDSGAPTLTILRAATRAFSAAKTAAPHAQIIVVGPVWRSADPPASIAAIRDALRSAAAVADVRFVDPIAAGWTTVRSGLFSADGVTLTDPGQRAVAERMRTVLQSLVR